MSLLPNCYLVFEINDKHNMKITNSIEPPAYRTPLIFIKTEIDCKKMYTTINSLTDSTKLTCKSNVSSIAHQLSFLEKKSSSDV